MRWKFGNVMGGDLYIKKTSSTLLGHFVDDVIDL